MKNLNITKQIILIIAVVAFIVISIISVQLVAGDEFINYYNTYKIYEGEIIYKDVNIVSTPLLFYIGILFFKILGPTLIVFRIYNICINLLVAVMIYKIFRNLKIERNYSIMYTLLLEILIITYVVIWGATYNILAMLLILIGLNFYINRGDTKYFNITQGIIIFLIIMTKPNIGICYTIAYVITELILKKKNTIKEILKTTIITIIFLGLYLIYLCFCVNLDGFISYTVLGIKEFSKNVLISAFDYILIYILIIAFISLVLYKKTYKEKDFEKIITLFIFGICMLPIGYPIADRWHMIIAGMVLLICMIYVLHNIVILELSVQKKSIDKMILIILVFMIISSIFKLSNCIDKFCTDKSSKFYMTSMGSNIENKIELMEQYILKANKKIIIVSPEAGIYKMNLGLNGDGIFDLPFLGNLGRKGEKSLIDKLKEYEDTYLLIHTEKTYWQESDKFREYIKNNYQMVGSIIDFDIYYIEKYT